MTFDTKEDIIAITSAWKGERFPDGRPRVADRYLDALSHMTLEEIWKPIFVRGYENQFIAMKSLHPEFKVDGTVNKKLVGRAVTAVYAPSRPDYYSSMMDIAKAQGFSGTPNQWVMDSLTERDVIVIDMYDKVFKGTFVGGNLTTALKKKTGSGGAVIWGGIRDVEQMHKVQEVQVYYRGIDPTPIRDFVLTGFNVPARLGTGREAAICLPGDVVYGCSGGVLFIPPQLVEDVVDGGVKTQVKDLFGFEMISQNKFTTAQIDKNTWSVEMLDLLMDFIKNDPRGESYRSLDWSTEYRLAREGDPTDTQSSL
jgi:regulator of RNase E activity RraA